MKEELYLWIDTETGGLDGPVYAPDGTAMHILGSELYALMEVGLVLTDTRGKEFGNLHAVLSKKGNGVIHPEAKAIHDTTGLTELYQKSTITCDQFSTMAFDWLLKTLELNTVEELNERYRINFAGNNVKFDMSFVAVRLPKLHSLCHYNCVDVSSIRLFIRGWLKDKTPKINKKFHHGAMEDIYESISEFKIYSAFLYHGFQHDEKVIATTTPNGGAEINQGSSLLTTTLTYILNGSSLTAPRNKFSKWKRRILRS